MVSYGMVVLRHLALKILNNMNHGQLADLKQSAGQLKANESGIFYFMEFCCHFYILPSFF